MTNNRYRLVTHQGGAKHVSSVVLSHAEAQEALDLEESMHRAAGWLTTLSGGILTCQRNGVDRQMWLRQSDPMDDTL